MIDTHESNSVSTRNISDLINVSAHCERCTLDVLNVHVLLVARLVVGALGTYVVPSSNGSTEHTTESVESTLVTCGHHLGDIHHQGTCGIAHSDGVGCLIVQGSLVQILNTVLGSY